jgi:hypothetical protein
MRFLKTGAINLCCKLAQRTLSFVFFNDLKISKGHNELVLKLKNFENFMSHSCESETLISVF